MFTLIINGDVFAPKHLGKKDILIAGDRIVALEDKIDQSCLPGEVRVVNAERHNVVPGFIDNHVHIIGGGGEGSYRTRTPELMLSQATTAGVTTIVGVIGTDGTTRTMPDLIAKAKGLEEEGITCFVHTGSYQVPVKSLTGSIQSDLILIDKIIGVGEIAISDHRSSQPTVQELIRLTSEARVGGMLSGKGGIVNIHVGDSRQKLDLLEKIAEKSDIPLAQFMPTHINRNPYLFEAGIAYAKKGGRVDFTTSTIPKFLAEGEIKCSQALSRMLAEGIELSQITFTSDAQASLPDFDENGNLIGLKLGDIRSLFKEVRDAIMDEGLALETAIQVITKNPAKALKLIQKGEIEVGKDADIVLLDDRLDIDTVIARGQVMVEKGEVLVKGTFE
ncbi:beta-aspartyl-peptidase [Halalkalibacter nanhaiisediminis]|uniref:Isoaspartyl dipeptidase n=1 Tax=Halalkalibacter nanhaiisediminis TaxID=688079 RepID=A0A562QHH4_9BACI|nr:beta-aspartyl-peptidase [Halalkalibacter nanhaiisediminis]TWI56189.1 beta-aspartyl-dipeptidase (metallo-type) [Halalkalibacter nanhaiisediminis]